jgi:hypothetical protein
MDELEKALARVSELELELKKASPSIFHQLMKMMLTFAIQKAVENAYDQYIIVRRAK